MRNIGEILMTNLVRNIGEMLMTNIGDNYWWQIFMTNANSTTVWKPTSFLFLHIVKITQTPKIEEDFFTSLGGYDSLNEMMSAPKWEVFSGEGG